jgi:superfamily II DNA helicase RecQ
MKQEYLLNGHLQQTELLADDLQSQGFNAKAFHAGMQTEVKTNLQDEFMEKDGMIVCFPF